MSDPRLGLSSELRRDFHDQLADLRTSVAAMGEAVAANARACSAAFLADDVEAALTAAASDVGVDTRYAQIEATVFGVVAMQAPVARDLRLVVGSLRIAQELERTGDLAASIARRTPIALQPQVRRVVEAMASTADDMLARAVRAYVVLDPGLAGEVVAADAALNELHGQLLSELFALVGADNRSLVDLALVARFFERIGDHAAVIAERVRFIAGGDAPYRPNDADEQP